MNEDSLPMVRKMVHFLYNEEYTSSLMGEEGCGSVSGLQVHARVFALGDKYDIQGLRDFAARRFTSRLWKFSTLLDILGCVPDVYQLTAPSIRPLRDEVALHVRVHIEDYLEDASTRAAYETAISEVPEFGTHVLELLVKIPILSDCYSCCRVQPMTAVFGKCDKCGVCGSFEPAPAPSRAAYLPRCVPLSSHPWWP